MRKLVIAAAVSAIVALGGVAAWQAQAAAPAGPVPQPGPYTSIHSAACSGANVDCPRGRFRKCTPAGGCWCAPC
jgi:hypothetical protein